MIAILGDLHFTTHKAYFIAVMENIVSWFTQWKYNQPGNELILAGDLLHSAVNGGEVLRYLQLFVQSSRFDMIHIIPGNHDIKWKDNLPQLAYKFLKDYPRVTIHERMTEVNIQGHKVLMMPHFIPSKGEVDMPTAYGSAFKTYTGDYDLLVGHFMDQTASIPGAEGIANLRKIKSKYVCLGHVHTRIDPEIYIGSVYANKVNEADNRRAAWIINNGEKTEDPLPNFLDFTTVKYGDELPATNALTVAYTFTNCRSESLVRSKYGELFLRKVVQDLTLGESSEKKEEQPVVVADMKVNFRTFLKQKGITDRALAKLCLEKL